MIFSLGEHPSPRIFSYDFSNFNEHNHSDSNYLLWKCNSRLIKKKHAVDSVRDPRTEKLVHALAVRRSLDSVAASIPFDQLNSQIQYYLSFLDKEIKQKIENFKQIDSASGTGIDGPFRPRAVASKN